jgi:ABC-type phosphate/phosphonate transport system permease subunit
VVILSESVAAGLGVLVATVALGIALYIASSRTHYSLWFDQLGEEKMTPSMLRWLFYETIVGLILYAYLLTDFYSSGDFDELIGIAGLVIVFWPFVHLVLWPGYVSSEIRFAWRNLKQTLVKSFVGTLASIFATVIFLATIGLAR